MRPGVSRWVTLLLNALLFPSCARGPVSPPVVESWSIQARVIAGGRQVQALDESWVTTRIRIPRSLSFQGEGPVVAVVDTGVDPHHPAWNGRVLPGLNLLSRDVWQGEGGPIDYAGRDGHGHGTHVTGLVLAVTMACPGILVLPIKAMSLTGTGEDDTLARAVREAVRWRGMGGRRVRVVNLSVGSRAPSWSLHEAIAEARRAGVLIVVAAGNRDLGVDYPAAWPEALAVGATTRDDRLASYSNRGEQLALCAPGGDDQTPVPSTWPTYLTAVDLAAGKVSPHLEGQLAGTSMAAPLVSGAAALLMARVPTTTPEQVRSWLLSRSVPLGPPGPDPYFGAGRLDVSRVIEPLVSSR